MAKILSNLQAFINNLHIYPLVQKIYRTIWDFWIKTRYLSNGSTCVTTEIASLKAEFEVSTPEEWRAVVRRSQNEIEGITQITDAIGTEDVFYDIGANIGVYTCIAGQIAKHTVSVEPYPPNVSTLRRNIEQNNIDATIINRVAADTSGKNIDFYIPYTTEAGAEQGSTNLDYINTSTIQESISVQTIRLDELINDGEIPPPDIVKIDVEGTAPAVLRGLGEFLKKCDRLFIEPHDNCGKIENILSNAGLSVSQVDLNREDGVMIVACTDDS